MGLNFYNTSKQTDTSISRILLYEKIDINSIYKVIDMYPYLDVRQKFRLLACHGSHQASRFWPVKSHNSQITKNTRQKEGAESSLIHHRLFFVRQTLLGQTTLLHLLTHNFIRLLGQGRKQQIWDFLVVLCFTVLVDQPYTDRYQV